METQGRTKTDIECENMHPGLPCVIRIEMAIGTTSTSHTTVYVFGWVRGWGGDRDRQRQREREIDLLESIPNI